MILLKCCTSLVLEVWEDKAYKPCGTMYRELAKVWSEWWYRMTTYWFTLTIKKRLNQRSRRLSVTAIVCLKSIECIIIFYLHFNIVILSSLSVELCHCFLESAALFAIHLEWCTYLFMYKFRNVQEVLVDVGQVACTQGWDYATVILFSAVECR